MMGTLHYIRQQYAPADPAIQPPSMGYIGKGNTRLGDTSSTGFGLAGQWYAEHQTNADGIEQTYSNVESY